MPLDADKILEDLKEAARPELEKRADELRSLFLREINEFVDSTRVHKLDDLLKKAAGYEVKAVTVSSRDEADQYAEAAEEVLRQIKLMLIAEQIVASREIAAMIQAAAISVWAGFKSVATTIISVAVKGAVTGLLGPAGGALANVAGEFLGGLTDADAADDNEQA